MVSGSFAASFSTYSSTTASSSARGTARLTSPHSTAWAGVIFSHSRMISRARRSPTITGSHWVAPPAGTEPCSRPTCLMYASSTMTARSHAICSSLPPPTQMPLMRASVGLPISRIRSCMSWKAPNHFQYSFELPTSSAPHERRSAPTQKARPSPVTTTTRMSSSHDASSNARASSRSIWKSKAFRTSGRVSVTVARGGAFS